MRAARRSWFSFTARVICAKATARSPISSPVSCTIWWSRSPRATASAPACRWPSGRVSRRDNSAASASANRTAEAPPSARRAPRRQLGGDERVLVGGHGEHAEPMPLVVLQRRVADGEHAPVGVGLDDAASRRRAPPWSPPPARRSRPRAARRRRRTTRPSARRPGRRPRRRRAAPSSDRRTRRRAAPRRRRRRAADRRRRPPAPRRGSSSGAPGDGPRAMVTRRS